MSEHPYYTMDLGDDDDDDGDDNVNFINEPITIQLFGTTCVNWDDASLSLWDEFLYAITKSCSSTIYSISKYIGVMENLFGARSANVTASKEKKSIWISL